MKKILTFLLLLSPFILVHSSGKFWEEVQKGNLEKFDHKTINLSGEITFLKKHIRSRDNFFILHLKDPNGQSFVEVKLFTIKKLKRINTFECSVGKRFFLMAKLNIDQKKNRIGKVIIDKENKSLECINIKIIEMPAAPK